MPPGNIYLALRVMAVYLINSTFFVNKIRMRKFKQYYYYTCPITEKKFRMTREVKSSNLMSVAAFYQMNPELDDRPIHIKKELEKND